MDIFEKSMRLIDHRKEPAIDASDGSPIGTEALRQQFFRDIVPACPNLIFLLLTKHPSNINKMIPVSWLSNPPKNVMFGASAVDQKTFNQVVKELSKVQGYRFLSVEPQLAHIEPNQFQLQQIHWIIQGGESGPHRRPFKLTWARDMREHCRRWGVPYFFKQVDKILPIPQNLQIRQFPDYHSDPVK
jgi:protein gp37